MTQNDRPDLIILRLAPEMQLKSWQTRRSFRDALLHNMRAALADAGVEHQIRVDQGRMLLRTPQVEAASEVLPRIFGISSFSPVEAVVDGDLDELCRVAQEKFTERVRGRRYAVRCKRVGKRRFSSQEVERRIGGALNGPGRVDLTNPEVTVRVDVQDGVSYFHTRRIPGPGGLPIGIQGRALALISGGFDSAVAAWYIMRRGAAVDYVFCNLGGGAYEHMVVQVTRVLARKWAQGTRPRLFVVDVREPVADLRARLPGDLWQVELKRLMYRAAHDIACRIGAEALITGEALGQVSSQTLSNLNTIDAATDLPVLRPLIGFDKPEIMERARAIGTAELSENVPEYCNLSPRRPAVRSGRRRLEAEEAKLDSALLEAAVEQAKELDLLGLSDADMAEPYIFTGTFPADAEIIDCQPESHYRAWHLPGAVNRPADKLAIHFDRLPKDRTYVLYCAHGTASAMLAEMMQQAGYEAYAFRGDLKRVKEAAAELEAERTP